MKVLLINETCGVGSHGYICKRIAEQYEKEGNEVKIAYGRYRTVPDSCKTYAVRIGNDVDVYFHALYTRITDKHGYASRYATKKFIKWAENYDPDLIWLHNIHGYYINIEILFNWIKSHPEKKIKWTLHDCWAFTGHCGYFTYVKCDKWRTCCKNCPEKKSYPSSLLIDNSEDNFKRKKQLFTKVKNMEIITPSKWLKNLVKDSFLGEYPITVVNNMVDTNIFKPTQSDFRKKYRLQNKKIILGVANIWEERKGLNDFIKLSSMLDNSYIIVLVGLSDKQIRRLPSKILGLKKIYSMKKLAEIYSASDYFVNPSVEETFGMTTLEAINCGTNVIVYRTSACEEIAEQYGGISVEIGVENIYKEITSNVIEKIRHENCKA